MFRKGLTIICLFCLLGIGNLYAQPANPKIRALKIEMVTGKMNLTPTQLNSFLPLYTAYSDELLVIYRSKKSLKSNSNSTYVLNETQKLDQKAVDIKGIYKDKFLKIINSQQLLNMYKGEEEFKKMLIERLKEN